MIDAGKVEAVHLQAGQGGLVLVCVIQLIGLQSSVLKGIPVEVLDESCYTRGSVICVGSESRCSFLDLFNFVYEFLLVGSQTVFEYSKRGLTNAI